MNWELTDADRQRVRRHVAEQLSAYPGPLPVTAARAVLSALRSIERNPCNGPDARIGGADPTD